MNSRKKVHDLTITALMAAVICILAPYSIPIPISQTPLTLATLAVYIASIILGWKFATVSVIIYILIGAAGVPVFSNFGSGFQKIIGPTGGYLIGYIAVTLIAGWFADRFERKVVFHVLGMILGTAALYFLGTAWMGYSLNLSFKAAVTAGVLPYIPLDIIKIAAAAAIGYPIRIQVRKMAANSGIKINK